MKAETINANKIKTAMIQGFAVIFMIQTSSLGVFGWPAGRCKRRSPGRASMRSATGGRMHDPVGHGDGHG